MKVDTLIEVTMTMNLREAQIIRTALARQKEADLPGSLQVWRDIHEGMRKEGVR